MNEKQSVNTLPWADTVDQYDVSIIIPTYNRADYIQECLDSLLAQTQPAKEIIVIDDGSEDNTPEILRPYGESIRYIRKENGGKPSAVNLGASHAKGNLIWIFDDDDVALPDAIATRIQTLKDNPNAGFVYSAHYIGSNEKDGKIKKGNLYEPMLPQGSEFFYEVLKGCFFHLASTLVRIEAYQSIDGLDESLLSSEDYDFQIRLARKYKPAYSKYPSFIFRQHPGIRGSKNIRYANNMRSEIFRINDQKIGLKIRKELLINEYAASNNDQSKTEYELRYALLRRMLIMASKGCISEMFDDLELALKTLHGESRLTTQELNFISATIYTGYAYPSIASDWITFNENIKKLRSKKEGWAIKKALAKGFFISAKSYPGSITNRINKLTLALKVIIPK